MDPAAFGRDQGKVRLLRKPDRVVGEQKVGRIYDEDPLIVVAEVRILDRRSLHVSEFESNIRMIGGNIINGHVRRIDADQLPDVRTLDHEAGFLLEISNRLAVHEVVSGYRMR